MLIGHVTRSLGFGGVLPTPLRVVSAAQGYAGINVKAGGKRKPYFKMFRRKDLHSRLPLKFNTKPFSTPTAKAALFGVMLPDLLPEIHALLFEAAVLMLEMIKQKLYSRNCQNTRHKPCISRRSPRHVAQSFDLKVGVKSCITTFNYDHSYPSW